MDVNSDLSSIMKNPKYSHGYYNGMSEDDLCKLLGVSSSPSLGGSLTSGSFMSTNSQDWVPKGVEFCSTVELCLYKIKS